jgi:glyoxylase-like metal-dependent hydrolase (beta-lactamase superfamily II)
VLAVALSLCGRAYAQSMGVRATPVGDTLRVSRGPARAQPTFVQVTDLGDSVWVLSAGTANVTACLTDSGWVLVDTGTRLEAAAIREQLRTLAQMPFRLVIDTHFHDDHAGGNGLYHGMGVPVLATARTRSLAMSRAQRITRGAPKEIARIESYEATLADTQENSRVRGFLDFFADWWREAMEDVRTDPKGLVPPDRQFTGRKSLTVAGTKVELREIKGGAHTAGDCVVLFPQRRVAVVGDLFAKGSAPWADQFMGDGSFEGIIAAQDSLLAWIPADSTWNVVPGHGPVAQPADIALGRSALHDLRACVLQAKSVGRTPAVIAADCAGAGFPKDQGNYAAWLLLEDWARAQKAPKRR